MSLPRPLGLGLPGAQMATHSSILAWRIPWTEEPGGPQSLESQELDKTYLLNHHHHLGPSVLTPPIPRPLCLDTPLPRLLGHDHAPAPPFGSGAPSGLEKVLASQPAPPSRSSPRPYPGLIRPRVLSCSSFALFLALPVSLSPRPGFSPGN